MPTSPPTPPSEKPNYISPKSPGATDTEKTEKKEQIEDKDIQTEDEDTKTNEPNNEKSEKEEKTPAKCPSAVLGVYRWLHKYFKSRLYFGLGIFLTILCLILSAVAKMLNERKINAGTNTLLIIFTIVIIYEVIEAILRVLIVRSAGSFFNALILLIDFGVNLYVLISYIQSNFVSLSKVCSC
jgi:hypothetical protein